MQIKGKKWYFVTKIVLTSVRKNVLFSDREKLLKFEVEGREFAKFLRSLENLSSDGHFEVLNESIS